jgi:hypothetical protein
MKVNNWLVGILSLVIIFSAGFAFAQSGEIPFARETVTVGQTAVTLTEATYGNTATSALLTIEDVIIYTLDGTTPTATVGHKVNDKQLLLGRHELRKIKMIAGRVLAGWSTTVEVTYFTK